MGTEAGLALEVCGEVPNLANCPVVASTRPRFGQLRGFGSTLPLVVKVGDAMTPAPAAFVASRALIQAHTLENRSQQCRALFCPRRLARVQLRPQRAGRTAIHGEQSSRPVVSHRPAGTSTWSGQPVRQSVDRCLKQPMG